MSAQDNLSGRQFSNVYRGIQAWKEEAPVGIHWSRNEDVANNLFGKVMDAEGEKSTVIKAKVHDKDVIHPDSSEFSNLKDKHSIWGPKSSEEEATVREGAPVYVTGITRNRFKNGERKSRTITYKKPREMKA